MRTVIGVVLGLVVVGGVMFGVYHYSSDAGQWGGGTEGTLERDRPAKIVEPAQPAAAVGTAPGVVERVLVGPSQGEAAPVPVVPAKPSVAKSGTVIHTAKAVVGAGGAAEVVMGEPLARDALEFVGVDPDAEVVWASAINDPNMSAHDRKNLIEDLNENGFADPNHPTADDLPLIQSRLALIEDMGPVAMDGVNAAAFDEAYKDLLDMQQKAAQ